MGTVESGMFVIEVQLKRHNFGRWEFSAASRHPKDVPFVREFCWGPYGLGAISPRKTPTLAIDRCRRLSDAAANQQNSFFRQMAPPL